MAQALPWHSADVVLDLYVVAVCGERLPCRIAVCHATVRAPRGEPGRPVRVFRHVLPYRQHLTLAGGVQPVPRIHPVLAVHVRVGYKACLPVEAAEKEIKKADDDEVY